MFGDRSCQRYLSGIKHRVVHLDRKYAILQSWFCTLKDQGECITATYVIRIVAEKIDVEKGNQVVSRDELSAVPINPLKVLLSGFVS